MAYYSRKSARIPHYDYVSYNYYFVTICTHNRRCIFGSVGELSPVGQIAKEEILEISTHYSGVSVDHYVVMPNHIHMILVLQENAQNLNVVVGQYKSGVSRRAHKLRPELSVWQRSYHDHIIRNQTSYEKIWNYIEGNPSKWMEDCFYIDTSL